MQPPATGGTPKQPPVASGTPMQPPVAGGTAMQPPILTCNPMQHSRHALQAFLFWNPLVNHLKDANISEEVTVCCP